MGVKSLFGKGAKFLAKHDRAILTGMSIASSLTAIVLTWNARPKCERVLEELNAAGASNAEKAKRLFPILAAPAALEAASIITAIVAHRKSSKLIAAGVNAVSSYMTIEDIRKEAIKQTVGEEKAKEIEQKVAKEYTESLPSRKIVNTGHGDTLITDDTYSGITWRGSKDFWDLGISEKNKILWTAFDPYGTLRNDEVGVSIRDILKTQVKDVARVLDTYVYFARDYRELPVGLEPFEFEDDDGKTELGYRVIWQNRPSLSYSDYDM